MARIQSIENACQLLLLLRDSQALTLSELAELLEQPAGTVRNWLDTLADAGFVQVFGVGDARLYAPGNALLTYARDYTALFLLHDPPRVMGELAKRETVSDLTDQQQDADAPLGGS